MTAIFSLQNKKIWVAGHNGMVGGALVRRLRAETCDILTVDRKTLDLRRQADVEQWLDAHRPDAIILAAARVGGIRANHDFPADFLYDNLTIETNVIHAAHKAGVEKLLFLGSSCIYPREAAQPINEEALLSGPLEPTNQWYALAKIAGIKLCQAYRRQHGRNFISAMPCNLYGPGDTYNSLRSHVIPALMMKIHDAKMTAARTVEIWGTGKPLREFMHCADAADALVFMLRHYADEAPLNIGSGADVSIAELARSLAEVIGYNGAFHFNLAQPDGVLRKLMDSSRLRALGWQPAMDLRAGLVTAYEDYRLRLSGARAA